MNDHIDAKAEDRTMVPEPVLPAEILNMIFGHLDSHDRGRAARVCRAWRDGVYRRELWRDSKVTVELEPSTNPTWFTIMPGHHADAEKKTGLPILLQDMSHLTNLKVGGGGMVTEYGMRSVTRHFRFTVSLNLESCKGVNDVSLRQVAAGLPRLQHLVLTGCWEITDAGIAHLCGLGDAVVPEATPPQLKSLHLQGCVDITDAALASLATGQRNLRTLFLGTGKRLAAAGFRHVGALPHLHTLHLSPCHTLTDAYLARLAGAGSKIVDLYLAIGELLTDDCFLHVAKLQHLKYLDLFKINSISSSGLRHLAGGPAWISKLKIDLCDRIMFENLDDTVRNVRLGLTRLQTMDFGCTLGNDAEVRKLVASIMPQLKVIGTLPYGFEQQKPVMSLVAQDDLQPATRTSPGCPCTM